MEFYADFGDAHTALGMLRELMRCKPNAVSLNALMTLLVRHCTVLALLEDYAAHANHVSQLPALRACAQMGDFEQGRRLHRALQLQPGPGPPLPQQLRHALMDFYAHFGPAHGGGAAPVL